MSFKIYYINNKYKKSTVTKLIPAGRNFKIKSIVKGKAERFIMATESIVQEKKPLNVQLTIKLQNS
jgi:hypothetical protein